MLPPKCHLTLECEETQTLQDLMEPINYGLQQAPLVLDTISPMDRTQVSSLECVDSWKKAKEDWFTTRFSYALPNPFVEPSCPPNSPEHITSQADQPQLESTCGRKTHVLETPLNGERLCRPEEIQPPIGTRYARLPKEDLSSLFHQIYTFDIIVHSEELAQILYSHLGEMLQLKCTGGTLAQENHTVHGRKPVIMLTLRIPLRSGGTATK
jgi:hypothetical protein